MSDRQIFRGRVVSLSLEEHCLPNGHRACFEIIRHCGGAAVLPLLPSDEVALISQYRPAAGGMILEIPAGRLEPGELPEECVRRELQEEIGYRAGHLQKLGTMLVSPGYSDEVVHLYAAAELTAGASAPEPHEVIETVILPLAEALQRVREGEIVDGKTQLALLLYAGMKR